MEKNRLIADEKSIAKIFNDFFTSIIKQLHLERKKIDSKNVKLSNNTILSGVNKFQNHPSILKMKSNRTYSGFSFRPVNYEEVLTELKNLDMSKTTQLEGIPTKKLSKYTTNIVKSFWPNWLSVCLRTKWFWVRVQL